MADQVPTPVETAPTSEAPKTPSPVDGLFAKKTEAKVTPEGEAKPAPVDSNAKQLALIAREQKRLAAERAEFEAKKSSRADSEKAEATAAKELADFQELVKANPLAALKKYGLDYQKLIDAEIARQEEESNPLIRRVKDLEAKLEAEKAEKAEQETKLYSAEVQRAIADHVSQIRAHIAGNAEKYEFLATYKAEQDVFDKIKKEFDDTCVWSDGHKGPRAEGMPAAELVKFHELTTDEACALIEADYEESALALTKLKKIQNKFAQQADTKPTKAEPKLAIAPALVPKEKSPSLSNSSITAPVVNSQLTRREREAQAFNDMIAARK